MQSCTCGHKGGIAGQQRFGGLRTKLLQLRVVTSPRVVGRREERQRRCIGTDGLPSAAQCFNKSCATTHKRIKDGAGWKHLEQVCRREWLHAGRVLPRATRTQTFFSARAKGHAVSPCSIYVQKSVSQLQARLGHDGKAVSPLRFQCSRQRFRERRASVLRYRSPRHVARR